MTKMGTLPTHLLLILMSLFVLFPFSRFSPLLLVLSILFAYFFTSVFTVCPPFLFKVCHFLLYFFCSARTAVSGDLHQLENGALKALPVGEDSAGTRRHSSSRLGVAAPGAVFQFIPRPRMSTIEREVANGVCHGKRRQRRDEPEAGEKSGDRRRREQAAGVG